MEIFEAVANGARKVLVRSAHNQGKTYLCAVIASWFHDHFTPSEVLISAPVSQQIRDGVFKELRRVRLGDPNWLPKANRLEKNPSHYIQGLTAQKADAFQGRHSAGGLCILFDEASGIEPTFWERAESMLSASKENCLWFCIFNPYDSSSPAYFAENSPDWKVFHLSALDHPNVVYQQDLIPGAINHEYVVNRLRNECRSAMEGEEGEPGYFEFEDKGYMVEDPLFDIQVLGRYPTKAINSVWSAMCLKQLLDPIEMNENWSIQIGADPARFGDDRSCLVVRKGSCILEMKEYRGLSTKEFAEKIKEFCNKYASKNQPEYKIPVLIDEGGVGGGVVDNRGQYLFYGVNSSSEAVRWREFPNTRSSLWFEASELAIEGKISISRLPINEREKLCEELRTPIYVVDSIGRRVVESKEVMKRRLKHSPDIADAFNLSLMAIPKVGIEKIIGNL
jgi:hypothetical protein